ncbi:MAG: SRPBCC family protein, partial [Mesonia sp.]
ISESEFQFSSFAMKVMGFLMPGAFKKQSLKYMKDFKAFVEDGKSVSNE